MDHSLVHQLLRGLIKVDPTAVFQELGPEAEVEQMAGGVLTTTHVKIHLLPVVDGFR